VNGGSVTGMGFIADGADQKRQKKGRDYKFAGKRGYQAKDTRSRKKGFVTSSRGKTMGRLNRSNHPQHETKCGQWKN